MKIVLLYSPPQPGADADALDVLVQAGAVRRALARLGHSVHSVRFSLDLHAVAASLAGLRPDLVFNLVEEAGGSGRHIAVAPALLEDLGIAFTGAGSTAMALSSNKVFAKHLMRSSGVPTPEFWTHGRCTQGRFRAGKWIVKSVWEHASTGLDDDCVLECSDASALERAMRRLAPRMGGECLAEAYVDGRECNVALLDGPNGPRVLPAAEILFEGFDPRAPRIVGWNAKWVAESAQSRGTPRRFGLEGNLEQRLCAVALKCWKVFGLGGYARVDFRIDAGGEPLVIDVNANPCLAPDAGYQASLARAEIPFAQAVRRILDAALAHGACTVQRTYDDTPPVFEGRGDAIGY